MHTQPLTETQEPQIYRGERQKVRVSHISSSNRNKVIADIFLFIVCFKLKGRFRNLSLPTPQVTPHNFSSGSVTWNWKHIEKTKHIIIKHTINNKVQTDLKQRPQTLIWTIAYFGNYVSSDSSPVPGTMSSKNINPSFLRTVTDGVPSALGSCKKCDVPYKVYLQSTFPRGPHHNQPPFNYGMPNEESRRKRAELLPKALPVHSSFVLLCDALFANHTHQHPRTTNVSTTTSTSTTPPQNLDLCSTPLIYLPSPHSSPPLIESSIYPSILQPSYPCYYLPHQNHWTLVLKAWFPANKTMREISRSFRR